jgi:stage V sporulation protein B
MPFTKAGLSLKLLLFGIIFGMYSSLTATVNAGIGKPLDVTKAAYISALINLIFSFLFIPAFGVVGASVAFSVSSLSQLLVILVFVRKHIEFKISYSILLKTVLSGVVFFFAIDFLKKALDMALLIETGLVLALSLAVYALCIYVFKVIRISDLLELKKIIRR